MKSMEAQVPGTKITLSVTFAILLATTATAHAVSIGQMAAACGDDSKTYCANVGYGNAMQDCLNTHYKSLGDACKAIMDRLNDGESVTLF